MNTVADLGFGKGGCPIDQKGAPQGAKPPTYAPKARRWGYGASPRKFENLDTPYKIETPERIAMKFGTVDYVLEICPRTNLVSVGAAGASR